MRAIFWLPFEQLIIFRASSQQAFESYVVPFSQAKAPERSANDLWNDDKIILNELLLEILFLNLAVEKLPAEDMLTTGLKTILTESSRINLWVVFGLQLFLDVQYLLGITPPTLDTADQEILTRI